MVNIGKQLRKYRDLVELSQDNVGDELNISGSAYGKYETNRAEINITTLFKLSELFKVSVYEILGGDEQRNQVEIELRDELSRLRKEKEEITAKYITLLETINGKTSS